MGLKCWSHFVRRRELFLVRLQRLDLGGSQVIGKILTCTFAEWKGGVANARMRGIDLPLASDQPHFGGSMAHDQWVIVVRQKVTHKVVRDPEEDQNNRKNLEVSFARFSHCLGTVLRVSSEILIHATLGCRAPQTVCPTRCRAERLTA